MSDFQELISGFGQSIVALAGDGSAPWLRQALVWSGYTTFVFVLGRLSSRVRLATFLDCFASSSTKKGNETPASLGPSVDLDGVMAEISQELDAHSHSTRRLNEQLDSGDEHEIRKHAADTRAENSQFQQFLSDRRTCLKSLPRQRGDSLSKLIQDLTGHERRAVEFGDVLVKVEQCDNLDDALSPLRECIQDLLVHNRQLQSELDRTREAAARQSQKLEQAEEAARIDALTGLPNRRAFDEQIDRSHAQFSRAKTPYVVALFDIDHFKSFNDEHGHATGDKVLKIVAKTFRGTQRATDHVARYGGEEFAFVLPRLSGHQAKFALDRHREQVELQPLEVDGKSLKVTVSAGLAEIRPGESIRSVLARADKALYAAKAAGRNQTCLDDSGKIVYVAQFRAPVA